MGPVGEVRIMPDPATFVPLPYAPGAGAMLADLVQPGRVAVGGVRTRPSSSRPSPSLAGAGLRHDRPRSSPSSPSAAASRHPRRPRPGPAHPARRQPVLLGHRLPPRPRLHHGPGAARWRHRAGGRALLPGTGPWAAGDVSPARPGAARRRQPRPVPGDSARGGVPARDVGEPGPQAHRRPGRQRYAPAHVAARRGPPAASQGRRRSSTTPATATGSRRPGTTSSVACSTTCRRWSR